MTFFSEGERLEPEYYLFHVTGTAVDDTAFDWGTFAADVICLVNEENICRRNSLGAVYRRYSKCRKENVPCLWASRISRS